MMDPDDVRRLITSGEGQMIEFKKSFSETREGIESLCAFANSRGGHVLFGVVEQCGPGTAIGVQLGKKGTRDFEDAVSLFIEPRLIPEVDTVDSDGTKVVMAHIGQGSNAVYFANGVAKIRSGDSNRTMPAHDIEQRYFARFKASWADDPAGASWADLEKHRTGTYERNRGLFLVHAWRPSTVEGQIADVVVHVRQHAGPDMPLANRIVKSVEYHLGPKFSDRTIVQTDPENAFQLEVSAYGPLLCVARVTFEDGHKPVTLSRYIDFE